MDLLPLAEYVAGLDRKRTSAGVLFRDERDRVLLVETTYKPQWEIPGGAVEAGEAPWTAAVREVEEELGISRPLGALLVIDHVRASGAMPEGLAFVFDGGVIAQTEVDGIDSTDPEVRSVALSTLAEAEALLKPTLHARITAALHAARSGTLVLCDAGLPRHP
ncbi:NUDIX domain-containing protein [Umezawaea beigongshangensis]|uniref:NUDIX domain-containing protein n=1 Tax=Umezawaea beigongshangensis TaxID=2780383 RepID=UPI0018F263B8|nr:NUDIX hydrolase [Umezawaea beigongshangensis]